MRTQNRIPNCKTVLCLGSVVAISAFGAAWSFGYFLHAKGNQSEVTSQPSAPLSNLPDLLMLQGGALSQVDIARMNLTCAQSLPGAEDLDVNGCLATLQTMAARVRQETEKYHYRYENKPSDFENSENFYKMVIMAVVLAEDFQVKYAPDKMVKPEDARSDDGFFADAHDVFLHGLLGTKRQGTCSSLPVLQVAVGRRLGYPLKLVTTKGHLFVRWEDAKERFNVEAAGNGVNEYSDDYYRHWPLEVSEAEVQAEGYLKSLTPAEELAVFMSIRGMCWRDSKKYAQAAESFQVAARLAPSCQSYRMMLADLQQKAIAQQSKLK
jgi:Transglutaminase-like superfamily